MNNAMNNASNNASDNASKASNNATNNAGAPHHAYSLHSSLRATIVSRTVVVRPPPYLIPRQPASSNPQVAGQAVIRPIPRPPREIFPYSLIQPQQHEVDIEAFQSIWGPEFAGAPPEFVRDALPIKGRQMLYNVRNTKIERLRFNSGGPQCEILFDGPVYNKNDVPSHVLAVKWGVGREIKFMPVHKIILAANCATLPYFPYSPSLVGNYSGRYSLPVVQLEVPGCIRTFHVLHEYLYTKEKGALKNALTPPFNAQGVPNLLYQITFIRDLWRNACALCVVDPDLYNIMQDLYIAAKNAMIREGMGYVAEMEVL